MSLRHFPPLLLAALLGASTLTWAQDTPAKKKATPADEEIQQAIEDLASSEFLRREKAAKLLWEAGRKAQPLLEAAVSGDGIEIEAKLRAEQILKKFRYGIYPDTPPELAEMLMLFRDGNVQQRRAIFAQLMQKKDYGTVLDLLETLPDEERNSFAQTLFRNSIDKLIAPLITKGEFERAETMLEIMSHRSQGARDLAAYHFFSGTLDKAIAAEKEKDDPAHFSRLSWFHRAQGDLDAALKAATNIPSDAERQITESQIRIGQGDIRAYLKAIGLSGGTEALGLALTNARLEGDADKAADLTQELLSAVKTDPEQIWYVTEAFLINDQPDAIINLLKTKWPDRASELLFEQRRPADVFAALGAEDVNSLDDLKPFIDERLALLSRSPGAPGDEFPMEVRRKRLEAEAALIHVARLHVRLGYLEEADRLFKKIGDAIITSKAVANELGFLVSEASESRRIEAALAVVRKSLREWPEAGQSVVPRLRLENAGEWWGSARNFGDFDLDLEKSFDRFVKVYPDLATNPEKRVRGKDFKIPEAALAEAKSVIETVLENALEHGRPYFDGIGMRAEELGFLELAEKAFYENAHREFKAGAPVVVAEKFAPFAALGDFYARQERWREAAEAFRTASELKSSWDPVSLYTLSWALKNSGDEEGAADALKLARLLPLGDATSRNQLAEEMLKRGDSDAALTEWKFIFTTAAPTDWEQGRAAQMLAEKDAEEKRYAEAARYLDRLIYSTLQTSSAFTEVRSYLRVRYRANYFRAMAAIARKDGAAAAAAAKAAAAHQPGDPTLSEEVFPALEALGQKAAVDEMFERAFALNESTCAIFPDDPQAHNSLAWLAARSKRRLDDAFTHATKAVELDPDSAAFIDTLAETYFAKGDRAKAIELSEKAVSLAPDDEELQGQLKRFKGE